MSVTFTISGERANWDAEGVPPNFVNLSNVNAADLLRWLGFEVDGDLCGVLAPADLRARCERRLEASPRNVAADLPRATIERANLVQCGRAAGYLGARTKELLELARRAGDRVISYG